MIAPREQSRSNGQSRWRLIAPIRRTATEHCFDRDTGIEIPAGALKTYRTAIAQYHLRPEHKFLNGNYTDRGITKRRHVNLTAVRQIGKELNRWEEKFHLGSDEGAEINYGMSSESKEPSLKRLRDQITAIGQRKVSLGQAEWRGEQLSD